MNTPQPHEAELPRRKANEIESPGDPGPPIIVPPDDDPLEDDEHPAKQHPPPERGV
jgi:hypothetical protein